jgi:hypothetical protein
MTKRQICSLEYLNERSASFGPGPQAPMFVIFENPDTVPSGYHSGVSQWRIPF